MSELASKYEPTPQQISEWEKEFLSKASLAFAKESPKKDSGKEVSALYEQIGELQMSNEFLKKVEVKNSVEERKAMVDISYRISISEQCKLLSISQSTYLTWFLKNMIYNFFRLEQITKLGIN